MRCCGNQQRTVWPPAAVIGANSMLGTWVTSGASADGGVPNGPREPVCDGATRGSTLPRFRQDWVNLAAANVSGWSRRSRCQDRSCVRMFWSGDPKSAGLMC